MLSLRRAARRRDESVPLRISRRSAPRLRVRAARSRPLRAQALRPAARSHRPSRDHGGRPVEGAARAAAAARIPPPCARASRAARRRAEARRPAASGFRNADLTARELEQHCALDHAGLVLLEKAVARLGLSVRAVHRALRVARTIADLAQSERVTTAHLSEAFSFRAPALVSSCPNEQVDSARRASIGSLHFEGFEPSVCDFDMAAPRRRRTGSARAKPGVRRESEEVQHNHLRPPRPGAVPPAHHLHPLPRRLRGGRRVPPGGHPRVRMGLLLDLRQRPPVPAWRWPRTTGCAPPPATMHQRLDGISKQMSDFEARTRRLAIVAGLADSVRSGHGRPADGQPAARPSRARALCSRRG